MEAAKNKPIRRYVLRKGYRKGEDGIECELALANIWKTSQNSVQQRVRIRRDGGMTYAGVSVILN